MKFIRDNFAYIFLFLIAGILIFITVSLQSIIFTQVGTPPACLLPVTRLNVALSTPCGNN